MHCPDTPYYPIIILVLILLLSAFSAATQDLVAGGHGDVSSYQSEPLPRQAQKKHLFEQAQVSSFSRGSPNLQRG